jgi:menaquinone reductase, multiheme cytochrome c subunit
MSRFQFPEWTQGFRKWVALLVVGGALYTGLLIAYGANATTMRIGYQPTQPVPYSHALHVGELGLDCRYCHNTVTKSPKAAIPPAATCMNCHTGIRKDSPLLLPIRESFTDGTPVNWVKVHDLPDYAYFDHSAHVTRGVGCESCHGRVDQMEVVYQAKPLTMEWCLECHRAPDEHLRPPNRVTEMGYKAAADPLVAGGELRRERAINPKTDCSTCHR